MMISSIAPEGKFLFAELTDEDSCHLSFAGAPVVDPDKRSAINIQLTESDMYCLLDNLVRLVQRRSVVQLERIVALEDRVAELQKHLQAMVDEANPAQFP